MTASQRALRTGQGRTWRGWFLGAAGAGAVACTATAAAYFVDEYKSGIVWPEPPVVTPGTDGGPPSDAVVLFDGKDLSHWNGAENWEVANGIAIPKKGSIHTKASFGDVQLHLEFASPAKVEGSGQGRGNSGIHFMGKYEIQILDSYQNATYIDGQCASVYKQNPPMVNACRKPGEWQTYDILFEAPHFDEAGKVLKPAIVTVLQNGVAVQNHFELHGSTHYHKPAEYEKHGPKGPISLQHHGDDVQFRNIWIRELKPLVGKKPGEKDAPADKSEKK